MRVSPVLVLLLLVSTTALRAQVGHPPNASPFDDYANGHSITPAIGYFGGSGGQFGIGAHGGTTYGFRYDFRVAKSLQFGLSIGRGSLERIIVDPFVALDRRYSDPVPQRVTFLDIGPQLNLTGGKTWHRLAPYTGLALGIALATDTPTDTSGYDFGTKFYVAPNAGVRVFLTSRLHVRGDVRGVFWKLKYPNSFRAEPPEEPGTPAEPNAVLPSGGLAEWTLTPWLQVGLGYTIQW